MEQFEVYDGTDLGAVYTPEKTSFRLWAPTADKVALCFYREGDGDCLMDQVLMTKDKKGTWLYQKRGDLDGTYYTYKVTVDGIERETADPYARAAGVNGVRSMVVDLVSTNPDGFLEDCGPALLQPTDAIVCEISVADITADKSSGAKHRGKYLGLTERGTKSPDGLSTGLDYLSQLGITHVQIMPAYDFGSIDEAHPEIPQYNWGYDPVNYNVPEGSYSTDPFHGAVRIREFKRMVQALHQAGLGVIMDVVYNHTYDIEHSCFQKTVPDYYYRRTESGYSDASACGNEVASDQPMVRKYIVESVCYWAREYHIDGFRFDLMGVLDIETMQQVYDELHKINPNILVYGEGWTGGSSTLPEEQRALKKNIGKLNGVGAFSDDIRDGVRGSVFYDDWCGFANGKQHTELDVRYSVVGASKHPQIDYAAYEYSKGPWAKNPEDVVNYVCCHDNMTLWDKLTVSRPDVSETERLAMNRLCAAIVMTSQGIPFFLSGEEFARSKPIEGTNLLSENSFNLPLYTNSIKYGNRKKYAKLNSYYEGLIALRKSHEAFRMAKSEEVAKRLYFLEVPQENVVAYTIRMEDELVFVVYNANHYDVTLDLPEKADFAVYAEGDAAGCEALYTTRQPITVKGLSATIAISK